MSYLRNKGILDTIEDFFTDDGLRTYVAQIRYAFPWLNVYVVEPTTNGARARSLTLVSGPDTASYSGTVFNTYTIGSYVLVCADTDVHGELAVTDYILGPAPYSNAVPDNQDNESDSSSLSVALAAPMSGVRATLNKVFDKLRTMFGCLDLRVPKRFMAPTDMLSGDTCITGIPGTGVSVLKHLVRIQCGNGCFVEMDSLLSRLRIMTTSCEYIGPLKYHQDISGRGSLMEYSQTAVSYEEGMRGSTEQDTDLKAMFRHRTVAGDMSLGWGSSVSIPSMADNKFDDVYNNRVGYDGYATMTSAKGFEIRKSLNITTPYQKGETKGIDSVVEEVEDFPDPPGDYKEEALFDRSLHMWDEDTKLKESGFPRVKSNPETWGITSENNTDEMANARQKEQDRTISPAGSRQYYPLPPTITLTDPHTKKRYTYFLSTSGLRQDPDGSMTLYDGYGSEIRMTRGNIIISPAADLIFRPGRDLHSMAGRHTALVANKDVVLHSSNQDVYIKGDRTVEVLSGLQYNGGFILDDRGSKGVLIRSESKAAFVSKDIFVGSIPGNSPDDLTGVTKGSGTVTLGGGSSTLLTGDSISVCGESVDIIGGDVDRNSVSWISVDKNRIVNASTDMYINSDTYIGPIVGSLLANIGGKSITAGNATDDYNLHIRNSLDVCRSIKCTQLQGTQVAVARVYASNASRESGIRASIKPPEIRQTNPAVSQSRYTNISYGGPWLDSFTLGVSFKYPDSKELGVASDYRIPGILWQSYLNGGKVWDEKPISVFRSTSDTSMVYPGDTAWGGVITVKSGDPVTINGGYVING